MFLAALFLITHIFPFKINYFHKVLSEVFTKLFQTIFTSVTPCLSSMLLNDGIVDIKKPDGICSLTFLAVEFSGLFLDP